MEIVNPGMHKIFNDVNNFFLDNNIRILLATKVAPSSIGKG